MFEKLKKSKKDKKKKTPPERMISLTANGVNIEAISFTLNQTPEGEPRLEVRTKDVCESLHYEKISFELKTSLKLVKVEAKFSEAISEKQFKLYIFNVEDYSQFFI